MASKTQVTVEFESEDAAQAFAELVNRLEFDDYQRLATDEREAYQLWFAGGQIRLALARCGYKPRPRPHYTLAELLANSDYSQPLSDADRAWIDAKPVGREIL